MRKSKTECVEGAGCGYFNDSEKVRHSELVSGWLVICGKMFQNIFFIINASESLIANQGTLLRYHTYNCTYSLLPKFDLSHGG